MNNCNDCALIKALNDNIKELKQILSIKNDIAKIQFIPIKICGTDSKIFCN